MHSQSRFSGRGFLNDLKMEMASAMLKGQEAEGTQEEWFSRKQYLLN
jgi:hypothetical protein